MAFHKGDMVKVLFVRGKPEYGGDILGKVVVVEQGMIGILESTNEGITYWSSHRCRKLSGIERIRYRHGL